MKTLSNPNLAFNLVLTLFAVSQLGETMYLPATPAMAEILGCDASSVQSLLGWYLVPYGLMHLIYGPLSDRFGRKVVIVISLGIAVLGGLFASLAMDVAMLQWGCFIMGAGMGSGGLMCRTVLRDIFSGVSLQQASSKVGMCLVIVPLLAPVIGAYILEGFNWEAIFWIITGIAAIFSVVILLWFEETNLQPAPALHMATILKQFHSVFTHRQFLSNTILASTNCAAVILYETILPFIMKEQLNIDTVLYAWLVTVPVVGMLTGSLWSHRLATQLSSREITSRGLLFTWLGGFGLLLPCVLEYHGIFTLIAPMVLFTLGSGLIFSTTTAKALAPFGQIAGVAGACLGGMQNMAAGLITLLGSTLPSATGVPMGMMVILLVALGHWGFTYGRPSTTEVTAELS